MILIVGGGIAGLSLGHALVKRGAQVRIVDARGIAAGASGVATSYLEPRPGDTPVRLLEREACLRWPSYAEELEGRTGIDCHWRPDGQIRIALDHELDDFEKDISLRRDAGWRIDTLSTSQLRAMAPALSPGIRGAALLHDVSWLNGRALCEALAASIRQSGGQIDEKAEVRAVNYRSNGVRVELADARILDVDAIVLCNGMGANAIQGLPDDIAPSLAVRGVNLIVGATDPARPLRHLIKHKRGTICPRHDGTWIVGTTYEAGEESLEVSEEIVERLFNHAERVMPDIRRHPVLRVDAGIRAKVADGRIHIGRSASEPRVFFSLGHAGSGFLRAPALSEELAEFVLHGKTEGYLSALLHR